MAAAIRLQREISMRGRLVRPLWFAIGCAVWLVALFTLSSSVSAVVPEAAFTAFESGQVRPLALSPDGTRLFAVNTPDNRLEVFRVLPTGLRHLSSVTVGLEPVAVAV